MWKWNVDSVNTRYEVAKQQYEQALKWLQALKEQKQVQLSQIKSQIDQVNWNKNLAAVNLWNIKLYSPYNGVITKKIWNIWEVVWPWIPVLKIANYKKLKWVFFMPLEEIQHIKIWNKIMNVHNLISYRCETYMINNSLWICYVSILKSICFS